MSMSDRDGKIWFDGQLIGWRDAKIHVLSHSLHYGLSVFEGVRAYGAIRDEDAGFQALPYFAKSWKENDPSVRYLLMQSAPLTVPYRINASFCATVR